MTDYLEKAKSYLEFEGKDKDTWSEQVNAIRPIALALVAIAERLDATAQDVASRVELASETVLNKRLDWLVEIERDIETVKRQQTANLDAVATLEDKWVKWAEAARIDERLENLERGKVAISEVAEMVDGATAGRLDEIEHMRELDGLAAARTAGRLAGLSVKVNKLKEQNISEEGDSSLRDRLAELMAESKDLPGDFYCSLTVGERGDEMAHQEITLGDLRKMVLAMNIKSGESEAQPALWEKLEQAKDEIMRFERRLAWRDDQINESQDYAKNLESKLNKILKIANDDEIDFSDMRIAIAKATY